jgi:hypothetical protein
MLPPARRPQLLDLAARIVVPGAPNVVPAIPQ